MNTIIELDFADLELQDLLDIYKTYITRLMKEFNFSYVWLQEKAEQGEYDWDYKDILQHINNFKFDIQVDINYLNFLPNKCKLSYIERQAFKAMQDRVNEIFSRNVSREYPEFYVERNFNRQYIVNKIRRLYRDDYEEYPEYK